MKVQWFSGPPPAVGWWPASRCNRLGVFRWWTGSVWSFPVFSDTYDAESAERQARYVAHDQKGIKWRQWSIEIDGTDGRGAHL